MNYEKSVHTFAVEDEDKENASAEEMSLSTRVIPYGIADKSCILNASCSSTPFDPHSSHNLSYAQSVINSRNIEKGNFICPTAQRNDPMGSETSELALPSDLQDTVLSNERHNVSSLLKDNLMLTTCSKAPVTIRLPLVGQSSDIESNYRIESVCTKSSNSLSDFTVEDFKDALSYKVERLLGEKINVPETSYCMIQTTNSTCTTQTKKNEILPINSSLCDSDKLLSTLCTSPEKTTHPRQFDCKMGISEHFKNLQKYKIKSCASSGFKISSLKSVSPLDCENNGAFSTSETKLERQSKIQGDTTESFSDINESTPKTFLESSDIFQSIQTTLQNDSCLSPSSVSSVASMKPLEWDNSADIGYTDFDHLNINTKRTIFLEDGKNKLNVNTFAYDKSFPCSKNLELSKISSNLQYSALRSNTKKNVENKQLPVQSVSGSNKATPVTIENFCSPFSSLTHKKDETSIECRNSLKLMTSQSTSFESLSSCSTIKNIYADNLKCDLLSVKTRSGSRNAADVAMSEIRTLLPPSANTNKYLCLRPINAEDVWNQQKSDSVPQKLPFTIHSPDVNPTTEYDQFSEISGINNALQDGIILCDRIAVSKASEPSVKSYAKPNVPKNASLVIISPSSCDISEANRNSENIVVVEKSYVENLISSNQSDRPHIRWYPLHENDLQDIKDAATQTSVSYLFQHSSEENVTSLNRGYDNQNELITVLNNTDNSNAHFQQLKSFLVENHHKLYHTSENSPFDSSFRESQERSSKDYNSLSEDYNDEKNQIKHSSNFFHDSNSTSQNLHNLDDMCFLSVVNHSVENETASILTETEFSANDDTVGCFINNENIILPTRCNVIVPHSDDNDSSNPNFYLFNSHMHFSTQTETFNFGPKPVYTSTNNGVSTIPKTVWYEDNISVNAVDVENPNCYKNGSSKEKESIKNSFASDTIPHLDNADFFQSHREKYETGMSEEIEINEKQRETLNNGTSYLIKISKINLKSYENGSCNIDIGEPIIHINQNASLKLEKINCINEKPIYVVKAFPKHSFCKNNIGRDLSAPENQPLSTNLSGRRDTNISGCKGEPTLPVANDFAEVSISNAKTCSESSFTLSEFNNISNKFGHIPNDEKKALAKCYEKVRGKLSKIKKQFNVKLKNIYRTHLHEAQALGFSKAVYRPQQNRHNKCSASRISKKIVKSSTRSKCYLSANSDIKRIKDICRNHQKVYHKWSQCGDQLLKNLQRIIAENADMSSSDDSAESNSVSSVFSETTYDSTCLSFEGVHSQTNSISVTNYMQGKHMLNKDTDGATSMHCSENSKKTNPYIPCIDTEHVKMNFLNTEAVVNNSDIHSTNISNLGIPNEFLSSNIRQYSFWKDITCSSSSSVDTDRKKNSGSNSKTAPVVSSNTVCNETFIIKRNIAWVIPEDKLSCVHTCSGANSPILSLQESFVQKCQNVRKNIDVRKSLIAKLEKTRLQTCNVINSAKDTHHIRFNENISSFNKPTVNVNCSLTCDQRKMRKTYFKKLRCLTRLTSTVPQQKTVLQPHMQTDLSKNRLQRKHFEKELMLNTISGHVNWSRYEMVVPIDYTNL